ncbi:MAG: hypothetical protein QXV17_10765 [Candidatus Micrarchaeaceae archaeon]
MNSLIIFLIVQIIEITGGVVLLWRLKSKIGVYIQEQISYVIKDLITDIQQHPEHLDVIVQPLIKRYIPKIFENAEGEIKGNTKILGMKVPNSIISQLIQGFLNKQAAPSPNTQSAKNVWEV